MPRDVLWLPAHSTMHRRRRTGHSREMPVRRRVPRTRRGVRLGRLPEWTSTCQPHRRDLVHRLTLAGRARGAAHPPRGAAGPARGRPGAWPAWVAPDAGRRPGRRAAIERALAAPGRGGRGGHAAASTWCSSTGTASGKSLGYLLPALTEIQESRGRARASAAPRRSTSPPPRRSPRTSWSRCSSLGLPGLRGDHARRRLVPRAAGLGPRPRGVRPDQPRHAAPLAAARAPALVAVLRPAALRRHRRVPPLPRRLRRARRADRPPAAAGVRVVRRVARRSCSPRPPSRSRRCPRRG